MTTEKKPMNLYQRINAVRRAIDYIQKDKEVKAGAGGNYMAVTHDQVTGLVREHMVAHGIICVPSQVLGKMNPKEGDSKQARYEATYDFTFVNEDDPQEKVVVRIESHAMDSGDKAPGKALSYAKKYAVLKLFDLVTGEDDESPYADHSITNERLDQLVGKILNAKDDDARRTAYKLAIQECREANDLGAAERINAAVAPKTPPGYPADKFAENTPSWKALVVGGKKTPNELIAFIDSRATEDNMKLNQEQKVEIASWAVTEGAPA